MYCDQFSNLFPRYFYLNEDGEPAADPNRMRGEEIYNDLGEDETAKEWLGMHVPRERTVRGTDEGGTDNGSV